MKIHVVDNDPVFLKFIDTILKKEGYEVQCVNDPLKSLDILANERPDIIFIDFIMPHLGGDDLCRAIRQQEHLKDVYIVVISAVALEYPLDFYSFGADACIAKGPFQGMRVHILEVVQEALNPKKEYPLQHLRGQEKISAREITRELLLQNRHLKLILENMSQGIIEIAEERIVYINKRAAEMMNSSVEKILGRHASTVLPQAMLGAVNGCSSGAYREKDDSSPYIQLDSRQVIAETLSCSDSNRDNVMILTDITECRRMEAVIEAVNLTENIGYIFSGIRHEIGNPVNSIKMALSVLLKNLQEYDKNVVAEFLNRSLEEISRIEYLLKALKNYSLFETPVVQEISVSGFLDDFIALVSNDFENRGIRFRTILPEYTIKIFADSRALHHVLLNLLTNAADALQQTDNPQITISAFTKGEMVLIKVDDNGKGISEEDRLHLFKPFFTAKTTGTGLGLAIVRKMLISMKGAIDIDSYLDIGTTVTIQLPRVIDEQ